MLWATLYAMGLLNEGRDYARRLELARLLLLFPLAAWALFQQGAVGLPVQTYWAGLAVYVALSLAALPRFEATTTIPLER
jgi:hypothetical protein